MEMGQLLFHVLSGVVIFGGVYLIGKKLSKSGYVGKKEKERRASQGKKEE